MQPSEKKKSEPPATILRSFKTKTTQTSTLAASRFGQLRPGEMQPETNRRKCYESMRLLGETNMPVVHKFIYLYILIHIYIYIIHTDA